MQRYLLFKEIGRGTFGIVYKGFDKFSNKDVAVKVIAKTGEFVSREVEILKIVKKSENCVEVLDVFFSTTSQLCEFIVFEFVPFNLREFICRRGKNKKGGYEEIKKVMKSLVKGLADIHGMGIIHRDLKPENVLIDNVCDPKVLKICDFGSAKLTGENNNPYVVTRYYRAPELVFGDFSYGTDIDVWAMGCIFIELFIEKPLFESSSDIGLFVQQVNVLGGPPVEVIERFADCVGVNPGSLQNAVENCERDGLEKNAFKEIPVVALDLALKMLDWDAQKRISAKNCLAHGFFDGLSE